MLILIACVILLFACLVDSMYAEYKKTEQIKYLSTIEGITPDEIIRILNETKHKAL